MDSFAIDVSRFVEKAKARPDQVVRKVTIELLRNVVLASPVGNPSLWKSPAPKGYVGGRLRANWNVGLGSADESASHAPDKSGSSAIGRGALAAQLARAEQDVYITNSVAHARPIEYTGHSSQAPAGMVRITLANYAKFIAAATAGFK